MPMIQHTQTELWNLATVAKSQSDTSRALHVVNSNDQAHQHVLSVHSVVYTNEQNATSGAN